MIRTDYAAVVVTFRRPESLRTVLDGLAAQTLPPVLVVVADNDPDGSARAVVSAFARSTSFPVEYILVGENLGPAGGWAQAAAAASIHVERGDWLVVVDDDDAISEPEVMATHLRNAVEHTRSSSRVGAVGLRGAHLRRITARLVPASTTEATEAGYLASNGAPAYLWQALDEVGFFDPALFFGFEDLDLGVRMTAAGWISVSHPLPGLHHVANTSSTRVAWREYYKMRSIVTIARRNLGVRWALVHILRSAVLGGARLAVRQRSLELAQARLWGAWDGWLGRPGAHRYFPALNPAKMSS